MAKEVARLLGEIRSPDAYQELLTWERRDTLHRDVRVVVLRALWSHVDRDETWSLFDRAAVSPDSAIATVVGRVPVGRLSPAAQRRLAALLATLLSYPDAKVRLDALQRCDQLPVADVERVLLPPLLAALGSPFPDEASTAARATFATYAGRDAPLVGEVTGHLLDNRRALRTVVDALEAAVRWDRRHLLPAARAVLAALAADPLTVSLRVRLAVTTLAGEDLAALLTELLTANLLHLEALMIAVQRIEGDARYVMSTETPALDRVEEVLSASDSDLLRRLALAALVGQAQPPHGWDPARLARLRQFRIDPSPLVAVAAQFTLPAEELAPE